MFIFFFFIFCISKEMIIKIICKEWSFIFWQHTQHNNNNGKNPFLCSFMLARFFCCWFLKCVKLVFFVAVLATLWLNIFLFIIGFSLHTIRVWLLGFFFCILVAVGLLRMNSWPSTYTKKNNAIPQIRGILNCCCCWFKSLKVPGEYVFRCWPHKTWVWG